MLDPITPEIRLADFTLTGLSGAQQLGELQLEVTNPNRFALSGKDLQLSLTVEGRIVGKAASAGRFDLPASATTTVPLQTTVDLTSVAMLAPVILRGGEVAYALDGGAALDVTGGRLTRLARSGRAQVIREPGGGVSIRSD